jgi:LPXTG-motif cell wall-anchored protein
MHRWGESPAAVRLRHLWLALVLVGAVLLVLGVWVDLRSAPATGPQYRWLSAAGILLLGLAGLAGRRRRALHALLLAASIALILASLFVFFRGGAG